MAHTVEILKLHSMFVIFYLLVVSSCMSIPTSVNPFSEHQTLIPAHRLLPVDESTETVAYVLRNTFANGNCTGDITKSMGTGFNVCYISTETSDRSFIYHFLNQTDDMLYYTYSQYYGLNCSGDLDYDLAMDRSKECSSGYSCSYETNEVEPWRANKDGLTFLYETLLFPVFIYTCLTLFLVRYYGSIDACGPDSPPSWYTWYKMDLCQEGSFMYTKCSGTEWSSLTYPTGPCGGTGQKQIHGSRTCDLAENTDSKGNIVSVSIISDICT